MSPPQGRPALAFAAVVFHAALALAIFGVCAGPLRALSEAVRGPVSFADEVPSLAWLAPALYAVGFLAWRLWRFAQGRALPASATWATVIVLGAAVAGTYVSEPAAQLAYSNLLAAPPAVQTAEIMQRLRTRVDEAIAQDKDVPDDAALHPAFLEQGQEILPNYRYAWLRRRPFELKRIEGARGPVDRRYPQDLAGTIYLAVAADKRHYWITGVVLLDTAGVRSSDLLPGPDGVVILTNSSD